MTGDSKLETDYLVVGAGALGMAFVDSMLEHGEADVVMVDRRHRPGGHWLDAYPFVQLHQPSRYYGVDSTPLGRNRIAADGTETGFSERATGAEICGYYDDIMRQRFLESGRVRFFPMCDYLGDGRFRSRVTDQVTDVTVRSHVVDATYMASHVPATDPAPFAVADGVRCVPVGGLTSLEHPTGGYVIVGGGKTAMDAICWLLDRDADPDDITWVRPRDSWTLNRAFFQPGQPRTLAGVVLQLEAMVASDSVEAVYERLEADHMMLRTDLAVVPSMMKGATVSLRELEQLRRIEHVVRLGHVERIEPDRIVLAHGSIPTTPAHLHVHCAAAGLSDNPPRAIFTDDTITLQLVTRLGLTLSGALQGFLETTERPTDDKNRLCRPTAMPHTPFDYLRVVLAGISTEMGWQDAPDLQQWIDHSRLNLMHGLEEHGDRATVGSCRAGSSPRCSRRSTSCRSSRPRPPRRSGRECSERPVRARSLGSGLPRGLEQPMNWAEEVTAIATAVLAIGAVGAVAAAAVAGQQVREARIGRQAEVASDFFNRWSDDAMVETRRLVASYASPTALRDAFLRHIAANDTEAYVLFRELDYFEQLGALEEHGSFDFELIRALLGRRLVDRWVLWEPSVTALGGTTVYPLFSRLARKMEVATASATTEDR